MLENYEMKEKQYSMKIRNEKGEVNTVDITYQNLSKEVKRQIDYFTLTIISIDIDKDEYRDAMLHKELHCQIKSFVTEYIIISFILCFSS